VLIVVTKYVFLCYYVVTSQLKIIKKSRTVNVLTFINSKYVMGFKYASREQGNGFGRSTKENSGWQTMKSINIFYCSSRRGERRERVTVSRFVVSVWLIDLFYLDRAVKDSLGKCKALISSRVLTPQQTLETAMRYKGIREQVPSSYWIHPLVLLHAQCISLIHARITWVSYQYTSR
jgi:hypothetical protein